jgi:hypothetical protein
MHGNTRMPSVNEDRLCYNHALPMNQPHINRLDEARSELSMTLHLIERSNNVVSAAEASAKLFQLSEELRLKYELIVPPDDEQVHTFYRNIHERCHRGVNNVHPRTWAHFDDHHFTMIRDVGRLTAGHIRWLLQESGIEREPDSARGILTVPLTVIKAGRRLSCPHDLKEENLGLFKVLPREEISERYEIGDRGWLFIDQMYRHLKRV